MKKFFKAMICLSVIGAVLLSLCACGGASGNSKETEAVNGTTVKTTAAETTATETTTKAPANMFEKGVWKASVDGKADSYFVFKDEKSGTLKSANGKDSVDFTCEQSGLSIVFHFGSADDVTKAEFSSTENIGKFYYKDKTVAYTFEPLDDDADTFAVPGSKEALKATTKAADAKATTKAAETKKAEATTAAKAAGAKITTTAKAVETKAAAATKAAETTTAKAN